MALAQRGNKTRSAQPPASTRVSVRPPTRVRDALSGHVQGDDIPALTATALFVHVIAASLWVGGLGALTWARLRAPEAWRRVVPGFSRLAFGSVLALAISGSVVALIRVPLADLFSDAYGVVVILKAALLGGLVGLGSLQRRRVVRDGAGGNFFAVGRL